MRFIEYAQYGILKGLLGASNLLPSSVIYALFRGIAILFWHLDAKRRSIAIANIHYIYHNFTDAESIALAKNAYVHTSQTIAETLLLFNHKLDIDRLVINHHEAKTRIKQLQATYPNGWVVLTAHFSNWELMAHVLAKWGVKMVVVGREGDNKLIDKHITIPLRSRYGNRPIYKKHSAVAIAKALKRGENVGILIDQKVQPSEGVEVTFLAKKAYTTPLVASLKQKFPQIAIVPIFLPRLSRGKYRLEIFDPIEINGTIEEMTQAYNDAIAKMIYRYPEQWLWMHDRWNIKNKTIK